MTGHLETYELTKELETAFLNILETEAIRTLYQPIISIKNGAILGYEALSRGPAHSLLTSPIALLSIADQMDRSWELEQLLRVKALERATFTSESLLFLNIDPNIIHDDNFQKGFTKDYLSNLSISPSSIVFELTERSAIEDYKTFKDVIKHYTDQGYSIAIDDAGSGYSGLKTLYEVSPKYLKIDMDFVRDIDQDSFKQTIVKNLLEMANTENILTIAEGIETAEELKTLIRIGVEYGQGYYIQYPSETVHPIDQSVLNVLQKEQALIDQIGNYSQDYHYIHHLMDKINSFSPETKCLDIFSYLNKNDLAGACIHDGGYPVGIINLREINAAFAKQYGHSVYSQRPVNLIMDQTPLIVDYFTPVHTVAQKALARSNRRLYDDIIVCKGSNYVGMVTMKKLLEYAINYEKNYAKELNPLTSLPGNVIINRVMKGAVSRDRETFVLYADLDNFKVYNDIYGFDQGDKIIKMTADLLEEISTKYFPYTTFLGHIGGDDFIIIADGNKETLVTLCREIIHKFDQRIQAFFTPEDLERNCIRSHDRHGEENDFALTAISLAGVTGQLNLCESVEGLSATLAKLKKQAKETSTSSFLLKSLSHD